MFSQAVPMVSPAMTDVATQALDVQRLMADRLLPCACCDVWCGPHLQPWYAKYRRSTDRSGLHKITAITSTTIAATLQHYDEALSGLGWSIMSPLGRSKRSCYPVSVQDDSETTTVASSCNPTEAMICYDRISPPNHDMYSVCSILKHIDWR
jgi:hypothetical protein